jgi:anti-anti-sigma regulatory factor
MLKITIEDSARELRLRLEGRLCGPWVTELRQCWLTAASTTTDRATVLDLREVDFIDSEGQTLLKDMGKAGVRLEAATPLIQAMVEEISQQAAYATVEEKPGRDAVFRPQTSGRHSRAV